MEGSLQTDPASFIYDKKYKELVATMDENQYFQAVRAGIDALDINQKLLKTLQSLIMFFKFPILIHLKTPILKILQSPTLLELYEDDLKKIAKLAQDMMGQSGRIYQLDFLFERGIDHTFHKKIEIKEEKKKFIDYIKNLSQQKKTLQNKIKDKTITQQDIIAFESQHFDTELKFLEGYFENLIKSSIKDILQKYRNLTNQGKNTSKMQKTSIQKDESFQDSFLVSQTSKTKRLELQQSEVSVCCRRSFYYKQLIEQPENINFVYKYWPGIFDQGNQLQLLKTICGLLNSQGGFLIVGIKQDKNTYKKEVEGYTIIEKQKQQYRKQIDELVDKCILPTISHDILKIMFVPIKNKETEQYMAGKYVIKISVRFGERKEFYSFKEAPDSKKQFFAVRTDNDTKLITTGQDILNIYKNRLFETPPEPKPIHKDQCPKPQRGKVLYQPENYSR